MELIELFTITEIKHKILSYLNCCDILCYSLTCSNNLSILKDDDFFINLVSHNKKLSIRQAKYDLLRYKSSLYYYLDNIDAYNYNLDNLLNLDMCIQSEDDDPPLKIPYGHIYYSSFLGYKDQLDYLIGNQNKLKEGILETVLIGAIDGDHIKLVKLYINEIVSCKRKLLLLTSRAIMRNHIELSEYLISKVNKIESKDYFLFIDNAIIAGNLSVIKKFWLEIADACNQKIYINFCLSAIENGHLDVLKFFIHRLSKIRNYFTEDEYLMQINIKFMRKAIQNGRLDIFKYLLLFPLIEEDNNINVSDIINDDDEIFWKNILSVTPRFTSYETIKYLVSTIPHNILQPIFCQFLNKSLKISIRRKDLNDSVSKILIQEIISRNLPLDKEIIPLSITYENIDIIHYLLSNGLSIDLNNFNVLLNKNMINFLMKDVSIKPKEILDYLINIDDVDNIKYLVTNNILMPKEILFHIVTRKTKAHLCDSLTDFNSNDNVDVPVEQSQISLTDSENDNYHEYETDSFGEFDISYKTSTVNGSYVSLNKSGFNNESFHLKTSEFNHKGYISKILIEYLLENIDDDINDVLSICINEKKFSLFNNIIIIYDSIMTASNKSYNINLLINR